jgi:hypothetical protein
MPNACQQVESLIIKKKKNQKYSHEFLLKKAAQKFEKYTSPIGGIIAKQLSSLNENDTISLGYLGF